MDNKEKILLIQLLLEDIRGNWDWENNNRTALALELAIELKKDVDGMGELIECIKEYSGDDGRYFRDQYPYGYQEMDKLHGLSKTIKDKSKEFQELALKYLTYPENRFDDYE